MTAVLDRVMEVLKAEGHGRPVAASVIASRIGANRRSIANVLRLRMIEVGDVASVRIGNDEKSWFWHPAGRGGDDDAT